MNVSETQRIALDRAEHLATKFISDRGQFLLFALAVQADGELVPLQTTDEFKDADAALGGMLGALLPMARQGQIDACVICTPMSEGSSKAIVYDVEHRGAGRVIAMQQYKKRLFGGWSFGNKDMVPAEPRLFSP